MLQSEQWFIDRIGKRIYRDSDNCTCEDCKRIVKEGLTVLDEDHARYLYCIQMDWIAEGVELNYRDTNKKHKKFLSLLKKLFNKKI